MNLSEMLLTTGAFLFMICCFPQLFSVWKNRYQLRGYSLAGSFITFIALICFTLGYIPIKYWMSMVFNIPGIILWAMITYYVWRYAE